MRILVIDDEPGLRKAITDTLIAEKHEVLVAESAEQGMRIAKRENPDAIICHLDCPEDGDGLEVIRAFHTKARIIAMSGIWSHQENALQVGAYVFLKKSFSRDFWEDLSRHLTD